MRTKRISVLLLGLSLIVFLATTSVRMSGQGGAAPSIDNDDIGGVVTGANRSEERRVGKECRSLCDWSSDVCSSDLPNSVSGDDLGPHVGPGRRGAKH